MMFSDLTFAIELIALASGIGLLIWSMRNEGSGVKIAKIFGYIISIISILIIVFTLFVSIFSSFEMKKMMQNKSMMNNTGGMSEPMQGTMSDSMNKQQGNNVPATNTQAAPNK